MSNEILLNEERIKDRIAQIKKKINTSEADSHRNPLGTAKCQLIITGQTGWGSI